MRRDPEEELIGWIRARLERHPRVVVDSGDDCAVVRMGGAPVLVKIDQTVEGIHFRLAETGPAGAGRKSLARVLSDFAAMGGRAEFAVVGVVLPRRFTMRQARAVWRGMEPLARRFGCRVVGGDVSAHRGPLMIAVAAIGSCPQQPWRRSGARPGQALMMTGRLGRSHWKFVPRVREAQALRRFRVAAAIDISDGFARDLHRLCAASGVGAVVFADRLEGSLVRGEDYEILFAVPAGEALRIERAGLACVVGRIVVGRGVRLRGRDGRERPLSAGGWSARFGMG